MTILPTAGFGESKNRSPASSLHILLCTTLFSSVFSSWPLMLCLVLSSSLLSFLLAMVSMLSRTPSSLTTSTPRFFFAVPGRKAHTVGRCGYGTVSTASNLLKMLF